MASVTQLRQGVAFIWQGAPYKVISYAHTHMGRGGGTIKVKVKNLYTGSMVELSFKTGATVEDIEVSKKQMQFLYDDGDDLVFMDEKTYEQMTVKKSIMAERAAFLKEGELAWLMIWDHDDKQEVLDVELPASMIFMVKDAAPNEKGNSASNMYKDAVLENGLKVRIPLFVNAGEKVKISTVDSSYLGRE